MSDVAAPRERGIIMQGESVRAILEGRMTVTRRVVSRKPFPFHCDECWFSSVPHSSEMLHEADGRPNLAGAVFGTTPYLRVPACEHHPDEPGGRRLRCPYGQPGDRLRVREAWTVNSTGDAMAGGPGTVAIYREEHPEAANHWRSPIHMPRWASRLNLEIVSVRVERVQEITEADAISEGLRQQVGGGEDPRSGYKWSGTGYEGSTRGSYHVPDWRRPGCRCNVNGSTPAQCAFRDIWDRRNATRGYGWHANPWVWRIEFRPLIAEVG
jgi:hypothetical protein